MIDYFISLIGNHDGAWTALATIVIAVFTVALVIVSCCQSRLIGKQIILAREEFRATHRPKIGVRGFNVAWEGVTADGKHHCCFTIFNEGSGTAFIREINVVLIHDSYCWNQVNRRVQFRNPDTTARTLPPGQDELYFTGKEFQWEYRNSDWFLVGFVRYADQASGGIERKIGFCRKWLRPQQESVIAMHWAKEANEEYEYSY